MARIVVRVGEDNRSRIDAVARHLQLSNSDTLRTLVALGLGFDVEVAEQLNAEMSKRRQRAEEYWGMRRTPSPRERASDGAHAPVVSVRLPSSWLRLVRQREGDKASDRIRGVLERGLRRVEAWG